MRMRSLTATAAAITLALALAACGDDDEDTASEDTSSPSDSSSPSASAASGTLGRLQDSGKIVIGVKFDQPGVGEKDPATGELTGFDIAIAKLIAEKLGIDSDDIEFKETVSANREPFLKAGTVDLVIASYSITDDRRKVVSQAGPYYETGQQLLVREDDTSINGPDDLSGKKVCSVTGSTSIKTVQEKYGAEPAPFSTYTECVQQLLNESVDAVTTDGAILLGYASKQPDKLKVVGDPFSQERYGIGFAFGDTQMCEFLTDTLQETFEDGSWAQAFADTLGKSGVSAPSVPTLDDKC
ncbi:glutamate ABC transporter substrate-binding protein [Sporichthya sp.]|uniref:glutamate ABC transporter substrate-binding protein n=1 Tax=Sporichthya sp. TaxID=65475 RepID=UPI001859EC7B|nr:glutamate ABC transporter substrate-binding protein [Sporichthya sp.]MBA3742419.1 glutamate ABC transporter substrate-binding protein [Sporichthya sp.]